MAAQDDSWPRCRPLASLARVTSSLSTRALEAALPPARGRQRLLLALFGVTLFLVFFPNLVWYPRGADNFDPSWQWSLSFATAHHFRWGHDYIFNYGPLGYLNRPNSYSRYDLWLESALFTLFAIAALFGAMAVALWPAAPESFSFRYPGKIFVALLVFNFVSFQLNPMWNVNAACYLLLCHSLFYRAPPWPVALSAALLLALCALIKTTFLYGGASLCLGYLLAVGLQREPRRIAAATLLAITFPLAYFLLFFAAGQRSENLLSFIQGSLEIVHGYSSMTLTGDPRQIVFALLLLALYLVALVQGGYRDRASIGLLLLSAPLLFLNWKEAFMRHNLAHYANFFTTMLLVFWLHSVVKPKNRSRNLHLTGTLASFIFLGFAQPIAFTTWRPAYGAHNLCQFLSQLSAGPSGFAVQRDAISADLRAQYQLPAALLQALRPAPTLIIPSEIVLAPAYGLPLALPPIPQICSAFTAPLDKANRRWLDRTQPPQVLFAYSAFDNRYPLFESPEFSAELLRHYRVLAQAGNNAVLARDPTSPPAAITWTGQLQLHRFGEEIDLPPGVPLQWIWARIWMQQSWPGEILSFIFKSGNPRVTFHLTNGASASYPFVYQTAPNGLLISPYVANLHDYVALHRGQLPANVAALSFTLPPGDAWQYAPGVKIEFGHAP